MPANSTIKPQPRNVSAIVSDLVKRFEVTERLPSNELEKVQYMQLTALSQFAEQYSPWFASRLKQSGLSGKDINSLENLRKLPVLTRRELQSAKSDFFCSKIPLTHAPTDFIITSGSTGEPVKVQRTFISQIYWLANGIREHLWHKRDFSGTLAAFRGNLKDNKPIELSDWGEPVNLLFKSGKAYAKSTSLNTVEQAKWLNEIQPDYLLIYPNNLASLLDELKKSNIQLSNLKQIRTIGETMPEALRTRVKNELNVGTADVYSSQELGSIAIECPESGLYHIMAENLIVEILNDDGNQCKQGETGRVVVTDTSNFATPLFRYDIGDYAEVGEKCSCGRELPTIKRIVGRERNMVIINGQKSWPLVGLDKYRDVAPIIQYQVVQKNAEELEARFVSETPVTPEQEEELRNIIIESLEHEFKIKFVYFDEQIPRTKAGKFHEFICEYELS